MSSQSLKKLEFQIRSAKCMKKGCLSQQKDALEIAWFGKQYEHRQITCSSCFVKNDEALKKSIPSFMNVLPLSSFLKIFTEEMKKYQDHKASGTWQPKVLRERQKEIASELETFQIKLSDTLKSLLQALVNFSKKVAVANQSIFQNKIFEEIIMMNNNDNLSSLLEKILLLIKQLNVPQDSNHYRFDDLQIREKRINKLNQKIQEITKKTLQVLQSLLSTLKQKNQSITKI